MNLKNAVAQLPFPQRELARRLKISPSLLSRIVNSEVWPARGAATLQQALQAQFIAAGITFTPHSAAKKQQSQDNVKEFEAMLMQKQMLTPQARKAFGLPTSLFGELDNVDELFLSSSIRADMETVYQAAMHGGMLAVVGESGSGKTTIIQAVEERFQREGKRVIFIRPYTVGMEDTDRNGKILRANHIAESIVMALEPGSSIPNSPQRLYARVEKALAESYRAGCRHVLIIEEAHALNLHTIRHLKRFHEQRLGFQRLLAIVLVGQQELRQKMADNLPTVREMVQRCEVVAVEPMRDVQGYVSHRLQAVGLDFDKIFAPDAMDAVHELMEQAGDGSGLLYPLAIGNVLIRAINIAANIGAPKVNANIIRKVR